VAILLHVLCRACESRTAHQLPSDLDSGRCAIDSHEVFSISTIIPSSEVGAACPDNVFGIALLRVVGNTTRIFAHFNDTLNNAGNFSKQLPCEMTKAAKLRIGVDVGG
jgi:hypothetical protein